MATVMALISVAVVGVAGDRAEACSLAGPTLIVPATAEAGGAVTISGIRFFTIDGYLGPDCGGDFRLVALTDVEVVVVFARASGSSTVRLPAPVTAPDGGSTVLGDGDRFTIGPLEVAVPADATSATISAGPGVMATVVITGAEPASSTTIAPPVSGPELSPAGPAAPVRGAPVLTG